MIDLIKGKVYRYRSTLKNSSIDMLVVYERPWSGLEVYVTSSKEFIHGNITYEKGTPLIVMRKFLMEANIRLK